MNIPKEAVEVAWDALPPDRWDIRDVRLALEAAAPHILAPALAIADDWDAVAEVFPRTAAGIFAKSHANQLREIVGGGSHDQ